MAAADASPNSSSLGPGPLARAYWLPPHGHGNGLDAPAWAPIADVPPDDVEALLAALRVAGVPGYAAGVGPPGKRRSYRLWVASLRYSAAEEVLRTTLRSGLGLADTGPDQQGRSGR
jgi:hypothetical protein